MVTPKINEKNVIRERMSRKNMKCRRRIREVRIHFFELLINEIKPC